MVKPWKQISSKLIGDFRIFKLRSDVKISPRTGKEHDFYVLESVNWVNVVAVTPDQQLVMVEQYRHGSNTVELEIPGGMMDPSETDPVATAVRELREETGYEGENARIFALITGLFTQLAHGGRHRVGLARIHHAAGDFEFHGVRAVAVLLHHHELLVGRNGNDVDPVDAVEDVKIVFLAGARRDFHVRPQFEDAEITDELRTDLFPRLNHFRFMIYDIRAQRMDCVNRKS